MDEMQDSVSRFDSIREKLYVMEKKKEVDPSILQDFRKLENELAGFEKQCLETKTWTIEDAFLLFHISRSSRMILEKMEKRFQHAEKEHENPTVVDLSKMVIPCLSDLYNVISSIVQDKKHIISESERAIILRRLKTLRDVASTTSMLPTIEDEKKGVLKTELKRKLDSIADVLQASLDEE